MKGINIRRVGLVLTDAVVVVLSCMMAILIINEFQIVNNRISFIQYIPLMIMYAVITSAMMVISGAYKNIWRYAQVKDFSRCFLGAFFGFIATLGAASLYKPIFGVEYSKSVMIISFFIDAFAIIALRTGYSCFYNVHMNIMKKTENTHNTLIVGAGNAAYRMIGEMKGSACGYLPVCIVDDDLKKQNVCIREIKIAGTIDDIPVLCSEYDVEIILLAIPSCTPEEKSRILKIASTTDCEIKTLPYLHDILDVDKLVTQAHTIKIEDLLGRDVIRFDNKNIRELITDRICMITGGGGSIGSELCRQIAKYSPKQLIIVDIYENNAYDIQQELILAYGDNLNLNVEIASVRDYQKMDTLFSKYCPQLVFHAAAHKHVPLMETNPEEAVKNNVVGTYNTATLADLYKAEKFVLISTDKAVNPTNVMGATKRCCEMIVQDMAQNSKMTQFVTVRFGNVLGSNGSVIPLFNRQIENGGPVFVTHPDIIRYFMTIPEAVSLILQAASLAVGGEIFVLDMGEPVKILNLAENLIRMHGKRPYKDIKIEFSGLRPGEKLYEELLMGEEGLRETKNKKIFIGKQIEVDEKLLLNNIELIRRLANANDKDAVVSLLAKMVPTFDHKEHKKHTEEDTVDKERESVTAS